MVHSARWWVRVFEVGLAGLFLGSVRCVAVELGGMGSLVGEQLWQTLSDSGLASVCVRGPQRRWADLLLLGDGSVGELTWLARDADEIAEQYRDRR
ncbi:hypothetical protein [Rhodococcus opacus]|uniref:hypothetical protein n=1 Tax=Rhodococcus opacus TaxID=37919 RepID=UPI0024BAC7C2|nr:hypothetical protein [Rhodococcus opacus]MDJ0419372.1 hypothetical protein [Rhodococcus opacus]